MMRSAGGGRSIEASALAAMEDFSRKRRSPECFSQRRMSSMLGDDLHESRTETGAEPPAPVGRKFCRTSRNRTTNSRSRGPPLLVLLMLSCRPVNVLSMSLMVIHGASASSSSPRGSTTTTVARRASLRDCYDDSGAALVEPQDSLLASLSSTSEALEIEFSSSCPPPPAALSSSHKKPPLFSLRNWLAPRTATPSARSSAVPPLGMTNGASAIAAASASVSLAATTTMAAVLCAPPLSTAVLADEEASLATDLLEMAAPNPLPSETRAEAPPVEISSPPSESVHLQLTGLDPNPPGAAASHAPGKNQTLIRVHSVVHQGRTYLALNTPKRKFVSFLSYLKVPVAANDKPTAGGGGNAGAAATTATTTGTLTGVVAGRIQTRRVPYDARVRQEWRELWKRRQLLTDRTELLAVYPSDSARSEELQADEKTASAASLSTTAASGPKRGGFADLLHLYTERFAAILTDEQQQQHQHHHRQTNGGSGSLLSWLRDSYGPEGTRMLEADGSFRSATEAEQMKRLRIFLEWFRDQFPYYYDRCGSCGASMKEDLAKCQRSSSEEDHHDNSPVPALVAPDDVVDTGNEASATTDATDPSLDKEGSILLESQEADITDGTAHESEEDDDGEEPSEYQTFIGYIYPSDDELAGKASRTELYHCHDCREYTRFPRYNSARHVLESRRGRCGEYSMLLYRFLRALGHPSRWVVDWSDHVWAEVLLGGRWVHLDPCEAAVDQNLLYQDWGKKQTYILGFAAPHDEHLLMDGAPTPLVEDITATYTSDSWEVICQRRDESETEIQTSIRRAIVELQKKLPVPEAEPVRL